MLFERFEAPGLAHYSYLVGHGSQAAVIDPQRDADVYNSVAGRSGMRITTVFETHRNEDYVIGSLELASRTGARIVHADGQLPYAYGEAAVVGERYPVGRLTLEPLPTPGHTPGSVSYLLRDPQGRVWMVFTGDALFAGDVGRTDLVDDCEPAAMAEQLYDSVHTRLLPLGDEVIVCPGHGAGSVCGADIAERTITTVGFERRHNPKLQLDRRAFVEQVGLTHHRPPYFRQVEALNLNGAPLPAWFPRPPSLPGTRIQELLEAGALAVDVRGETAFATAHVPGAVSVCLPRLAQYGGALLPPDRPLLLVADDRDVEAAARDLARLGFDELAGALGGGMGAWEMGGRPLAATDTVSVHQLCDALDGVTPAHLLDVRAQSELRDSGVVEGAVHIPLAEVPGRLVEIPDDAPLYVFCGSGARAMMAASLLERAGRADVHVVLGGVSAWRSTTCPLRPPAAV